MLFRSWVARYQCQVRNEWATDEGTHYTTVVTRSLINTSGLNDVTMCRGPYSQGIGCLCVLCRVLLALGDSLLTHGADLVTLYCSILVLILLFYTDLSYSNLLTFINKLY